MVKDRCNLDVPFRGVDSSHEGQCVPACFKMCIDFLEKTERITIKKKISLKSIDKVVCYRSPRTVPTPAQIARGIPYSEYGVEYQPLSKPMKALDKYLWERGLVMKYEHYPAASRVQRLVCGCSIPLIPLISLGDWKVVLESTEQRNSLVIEGCNHDVRHALIITGFVERYGNYLISLLNPDSRDGSPLVPTAGLFMRQWRKSGGYGWCVFPRSETDMVRDASQQGLEAHIE